MANTYQPRLGDWYKSITSDRFEIVALDEDAATMEVQYFDGAVEEIDFDTWNEMEIVPIEAPEDWSGSMDLEKEDYGVDLELTAPNDHINPLDDVE
jgi:hypothetical protein